MINELIPCPMCGYDKLKIRNKKDVWGGFLIDNGFYIKCRCGLTTKTYKTRTNLIRYWNRRAEVVVQGIQSLV